MLYAGPGGGYRSGMWTERYGGMARWARRARDRRRARLAAIHDFDEYLIRVSYGLRDSGLPYDTWRHTRALSRTLGGGTPR